MSSLVKNWSTHEPKETPDCMQLGLTNSKSRKDDNNASRRHRTVAKDIGWDIAETPRHKRNENRHRNSRIAG